MWFFHQLKENKMKLLLENWREYMKETNIYRRVVLNELTQLTERELKDFPLSKEEMDKIRDWAQLEGEPLFLGSGTCLLYTSPSPTRPY